MISLLQVYYSIVLQKHTRFEPVFMISSISHGPYNEIICLAEIEFINQQRIIRFMTNKQ